MALATLRIFFELGQRVSTEGLWNKFFAPSVGQFLKAKAKEEGIRQVVWQKVSAGYLRDKKSALDIFGGTPLRLPQCLELIDEEDRLRHFSYTYCRDLSGIRAFMLKANGHPLSLRAED